MLNIFIILLFSYFLSSISSNKHSSSQNNQNNKNNNQNNQDNNLNPSFLSKNNLQSHKNEYISSFRCVDDGGYIHPSLLKLTKNISLWENYSKTGCVFYNVCLKTVENNQFFPLRDGKNIVTMQYFLGNQTELPFPKKFQPARIKWDSSPVHFDFQGVSRTLLESQIDITHRVGLISDWCTFNLGHLLVDFMLAHYILNLRLGNGEDYEFQLISTNPIHPNSLEPTFGPGLAKYPMDSLDNISKKKSIQSHHVCFREINIGLSTYLHVPMPGDVVYRFQQYYLKNMGFSLRNIRKGNLIVMSTKSKVNQHVGGRHYINPDVIKEKYSSKYSNFRFEEFVGLTVQQQIELMQQTSIFITPGGGASFIGLFLPINAIMIVLDIFDYRTNQSIPFASETEFWNGCTWIKVWRHVVTPEEYYCLQGLSYCQNKYYEGIYNLNLDRLSILIDLALKEISEKKNVNNGWYI